MHFASDNWAGAHPRISEALGRAASGYAPAYGNSPLDRKVADMLSDIFEREVAVFFVGTGTAANALALTAVNRPGGVAFAHRDAHVIEDECGAPEYFTGGARLCPVSGRLGRIEPEALERAMEKYPAEFVHAGQPMAVTVTQATEAGTVYGLDDIRAIAAIAARERLPLHMDGARFANALVSLGATPAEMTWKAGVELLSFGGTKNGCWCAEALIVFEPERAAQVPFLRKRAAQLFSKSRFIAAQFEAYLEGGLWLDLARHSNAMSARLAEAIRASPRLRLAWEPQANEVFAAMPAATMEELKGKGATFAEWNVPDAHRGEIGEDEVLCRFVTSFATTEEDVDRFAALIG